MPNDNRKVNPKHCNNYTTVTREVKQQEGRSDCD